MSVLDRARDLARKSIATSGARRWRFAIASVRAALGDCVQQVSAELEQLAQRFRARHPDAPLYTASDRDDANAIETAIDRCYTAVIP